MVVTPELINAVRIEIQDTNPALPILDDSEITYALQTTGSVRKAWPICAMYVIGKLSQSGDEGVGPFMIKGSKAAEQYRMMLDMRLKNPQLNPVLDSLGSYTDSNGKVQNPIYAGGISVSDMQENTANSDNNYIPDPVYQKGETNPFSGPWSV